MAKYNKTGITQMYAKPKFVYFLPIIGYFIMMADLSKNEKAAGLMDKETPGGKLIATITKKFFMYLNILFIVVMAITLVTVVPQWFFWKKHILKAVQLNEEAKLY